MIENEKKTNLWTLENYKQRLISNRFPYKVYTIIYR